MGVISQLNSNIFSFLLTNPCSFRVLDLQTGVRFALRKYIKEEQRTLSFGSFLNASISEVAFKALWWGSLLLGIGCGHAFFSYGRVPHGLALLAKWGGVLALVSCVWFRFTLSAARSWANGAFNDCCCDLIQKRARALAGILEKIQAGSAAGDLLHTQSTLQLQGYEWIPTERARILSSGCDLDKEALWSLADSEDAWATLSVAYVLDSSGRYIPGSEPAKERELQWLIGLLPDEEFKTTLLTEMDQMSKIDDQIKRITKKLQEKDIKIPSLKPVFSESLVPREIRKDIPERLQSFWSLDML